VLFGSTFTDSGISAKGGKSSTLGLWCAAGQAVYASSSPDAWYWVGFTRDGVRFSEGPVAGRCLTVCIRDGV
jgi:hypothetical protein